MKLFFRDALIIPVNNLLKTLLPVLQISLLLLEIILWKSALYSTPWWGRDVL